MRDELQVTNINNSNNSKEGSKKSSTQSLGHIKNIPNFKLNILENKDKSQEKNDNEKKSNNKTNLITIEQKNKKEYTQLKFNKKKKIVKFRDVIENNQKYSLFGKRPCLVDIIDVESYKEYNKIEEVKKDNKFKKFLKKNSCGLTESGICIIF